MGVQIQKQNKTLAFRLPAETWQQSHVPALEKGGYEFHRKDGRQRKRCIGFVYGDSIRTEETWGRKSESKGWMRILSFGTYQECLSEWLDNDSNIW